MSPNKETFDRRFKESRGEFVNELAGSIAEIRLIWKQYNKRPSQSKTLSKMKAAVHGLISSSVIFQFPQLESEAKKLESVLDTLIHQDFTPSDAYKERVDYLLIALDAIQIVIAGEIPALPSTPNHKAKFIAILDTNKETSLNLARQLMYYGCHVTIINDIKTLESTLQKDPPMLFLVEERFAHLMLGTQPILKAIRTHWHFHCPIIYLASKSDFESRMAAVNAGANAYFTKPMDFSLLLERIQILTNMGIVEPYRVLLLDDDTEQAKYYASILEQGGMKIFIESNPELILSQISESEPELVIINLLMPNYNGIDIVKVIRQHQSLFALPLILLISDSDVNLNFLAREAGADDLLMKPITEINLFDSVLSRVQRARYMNISMSKDSLTGLSVHRKIRNYLKMHIDIAKRYDEPLSYIILDIDHFKKVNDKYGHITGDNVLITLANLLKSSVRITDFVGRYGGEEFVIILPRISEEEAFISIQRIRQIFAETNHQGDPKNFKITFSAGIASFPKYGDVESIMAVADRALYQAKEQGRNQAVIG